MPNKKNHRFINGIEHKHCSKCDSWLTLDSFYSKDTWDGLAYLCKTCFLKSKSPDINKRATKKYYKTHKKEIRERQRNKYLTNPRHRIERLLRRRFAIAIKSQNAWGYRSVMEYVGCEIDFLKSYIESKFDVNMSWENHGTYWHIDHIRPCASFDLSDIEQQKICFHYTNLQPLEAHENMSKRDKWAGNGFIANYG